MDCQIVDSANPLWSQTLSKLRHDVYHLPEYVRLEAKRTKANPEAFLISDREQVFFVPYLLRRCDDLDTSATQQVFDIISPYGYPGILLNEAGSTTPGFADFAMNELKCALKAKGVCSVFFRLHPILNGNFTEIFQPGTFTANGETVSVDLKLSESQLWAHTRKGHQSTINKCKRIGLSARIVEFEQYIDEFIAIYEETMNRVEAGKSYYFTHDYFLDLLKLGEKIHLCIVESGKEIAAASLFFESCGIVQAHLGGTKTAFIEQSPFNLLLDYVRFWAKERGNEFLHLGGGIGGSKEDSLYKFKSGFSRQRHNFLTLRLITDQEKYLHLVELRAKSLNTQPEELLQSNFFPVYRSVS